jgi:hypothetical protein
MSQIGTWKEFKSIDVGFVGGAFPYAYSPQIICAPCLKCDLHNYKKQLG